MEATLVHLSHSPWSLKACFALRHHGIQARLTEYRPLSGELGLRLRLRKLGGKVTVPVLFAEEGVYADSWDIARFAERTGSGASLIPATRHDEVAEWNAASERLMFAGRARATVRAAANIETITENLPRPLRNIGLFHTLGRQGLAAFARKYGIAEADFDRHEHAMRTELTKLRDALAGRRSILDAFSYADVAMALALQLVDPLPETPMGPAVRRASTDATLKRNFADLLEWRDALHAERKLV